MKAYAAHIIAFIGMFLLGSCTSEQPEPTPQPVGICLSVGVPDVTVEATRALPCDIDAPKAEQCSLRVVGTDMREYYNGPYREFIMVPYGDFTVTATYGDNPVLAKDSPYYEGTLEDGSGNATTVSVTDSNPNPSIAITCRVANALASIVYHDHAGNVSTSCFDEQFLPGYYVEATLDGAEPVCLTNNAATATTDHVYFRAGTAPTFTFHGTRSHDGQAVTIALATPTAVSARHHLILHLTVSASGDAILVTSAESADNSTPLVRPQI